jgi:hypothetical protein
LFKDEPRGVFAFAALARGTENQRYEKWAFHFLDRIYRIKTIKEIRIPVNLVNPVLYIRRIFESFQHVRRPKVPKLCDSKLVALLVYDMQVGFEERNP